MNSLTFSRAEHIKINKQENHSRESKFYAHSLFEEEEESRFCNKSSGKAKRRELRNNNKIKKKTLTLTIPFYTAYLLTLYG